MRSTPSTASSARLAGTLLGAGCAFCYALTIIFGRELAQDGFETATVLGIRFSIAAIATFLLLKAIGRPLLPVPGERLRTFVIGGIGYGLESSFFFAGLERGSAAAVVLLFYSYPAMVTVFGRLWTRRTPLTLGLSIGGAIVVVAAGGDLAISRVGIICALTAAAAFATYLLVSDRLITRSESLTVAAWVSAGAASAMILRGVATATLESPSGELPMLLANGLASAGAFGLMFAALRRIGPRRTSIVMTLEALFAIVLAALFLNETIGLLQMAGGAAILAATLLTAVERETVEPEVAPAGP